MVPIPRRVRRGSKPASERILGKLGADPELARGPKFTELRSGICSMADKAKLTPRERSVLMEALFNGWSLREIAEQHNMTPSAAKQMEDRAIAKIRGVMQAEMKRKPIK